MISFLPTTSSYINSILAVIYLNKTSFKTWLIVLWWIAAWAFSRISISQIISFLIFSMFPLRYGRIIPNGFWVIGFQTILDDAAVSASSKWDPASFPKQWPEFVERGRVLSWKTVEGLTIVEWDITVLAGVAVSSYSKWDPVRVSKQWPELF